MARPREFEQTAVLEAAISCFVNKGYEATSVRDLAARMNITGASLYNAFGDKRSLYRSALDHYTSAMRDRIDSLEQTDLPLAALRRFFAEIIDRSVAGPMHRGCLLANSLLEANPDDDALRGAQRDQLDFIQGFFQRCIAAGQAGGTITPDPPAESLAALLLSLLLGLRVTARTNPGRAALEAIVSSLFAMLAMPTSDRAKSGP